MPPSVEAIMSVQVMPSILRCHLTVGTGVEGDALVKDALSPKQTDKFAGCELIVGIPIICPITKSPKVVSPVAWVLAPVRMPTDVVAQLGLL